MKINIDQKISPHTCPLCCSDNLCLTYTEEEMSGYEDKQWIIKCEKCNLVSTSIDAGSNCVPDGIITCKTVEEAIAEWNRICENIPRLSFMERCLIK